MNRAMILIVGEPEFCAGVGDEVRGGTGLRVSGVTSLEAAQSVLRSGIGDTLLAIVDAGLPDDRAFTVCAELTQAHRNLPVMMIGAPGRRTDDADGPDELRGLRAGALDYVARPHNRAEVMARIRAHLRSLANCLDVEITIGPYAFLPGQRSLTNRRTRARIWLTVKESRLLRELCLADDQPVPAASLMRVGWGPKATCVHTLHTHIYRLRTKLGPADRGGPMLLTTRSGYRLVA